MKFRKPLDIEIYKYIGALDTDALHIVILGDSIGICCHPEKRQTHSIYDNQKENFSLKYRQISHEEAKSIFSYLTTDYITERFNHFKREHDFF